MSVTKPNCLHTVLQKGPLVVSKLFVASASMNCENLSSLFNSWTDQLNIPPTKILDGRELFKEDRYKGVRIQRIRGKM